MKIIIIYGSTHGCTEKCASKLADLLSNHQVTVAKLTKSSFDITAYEAVIIGSSIRLGKINRKIGKFCRTYAEELSNKKIGLFVCCMNGTDQARAYVASQFSKELRQQALVTGYFGGELNFDQMVALERSLLQRAIGLKSNLSLINWEALTEFATEFRAAAQLPAKEIT